MDEKRSLKEIVKEFTTIMTTLGQRQVMQYMNRTGLSHSQMMTIGLGTRIFLGGGTGYVVWPGTQFRTNAGSINTACQLVQPELWLSLVMPAV